jgi:hypothetical protein
MFRVKRCARVERFSETPDSKPTPGLVAMLQTSPKSCRLAV